jgi:16S rRNA processing protein RimM
VRGQVSLRLRTDRPDARFRVGTVFTLHDADPTAPASLTLESYRATPAGAVAGFHEIRDRSAAEALTGLELTAEVDPAEEPDGWYPSQLKGARVELPDGTVAGVVGDLLSGPGQDLLEVLQVDGSSALVPFVAALVPVVDAAAGRVVVDPPPGLLTTRPAPDEP